MVGSRSVNVIARGPPAHNVQNLGVNVPADQTSSDEPVKDVKSVSTDSQAAKVNRVYYIFSKFWNRTPDQYQF